MDKQDEIEQLDAEIDAALAELNSHQCKFALVLSEGNETQTGAAVVAGAKCGGSIMIYLSGGLPERLQANVK